MIEDIIRFILRLALELFWYSDLIQFCLGWVGVLAAWAFSLGRVGWDYEEPRSVLLGAAAVTCIASGGLAWWWSFGPTTL